MRDLDVPNVRIVIHWQQPASVEDLLQEYGRAGRDGKPSVSVVFHDGEGDSRDAGRLKFMAEKTVEEAALEPSERAAMLEQRFRQINQVARLLRSRSYFRRSISSYFEGGAAHISEQILDWVFGASAKKFGSRRAAMHAMHAKSRSAARWVSGAARFN